ncbi:MAG: rhomboid family intramembrane serine protease [Akkermansiaceae bacterium]|nr:rhomboid family intramembrane serine protease [Akkermansiaceae bacterium]NNM29921.1 rhomboid family intramembrane serine protease [Akkermansiaceae bacterium]
MSEEPDAPAWAAPEVYPPKPSGSGYGAMSHKGRETEFDGEEALAAHVQASRATVVAVWTPETERMVPPEAVVDLLEPLRLRFIDTAEANASDARRNTIIFALVVGWSAVAAMQRGIAPYNAPTVGFAALLLVVVGLLPWYEAWKEHRSAWALNEERLVGEADEARFDFWLRQQKYPCTIFLIAVMMAGVAGQLFVGLDTAVPAAGLVKEGGYLAGDWWRLLTGPFLHGHALHWVLNMLALWYLGRRVEALARWPHLPMVFLVSMVVGGIATVALVPARPSIGASGGVLGLLGFLAVFEMLHGRLVPRPARRRLAAGILLAFVIGFLGYRFVDNAAHAGGLAAGALYALLVFPRSRSVRRPRITRSDLVTGILALGVLTASALLTGWLLVAS